MPTYNVNPGATGGSGAYGLVPGQTAAPPSIWDELNSSVPNYGALTTTATGDIGSMLKGNLSPGTMGNIWDTAAARGIDLGQPNSPLSNRIGLGITGNTSEDLTQKGLSDYFNFGGMAGGMQQNPGLLASLSENNAMLGAAPSPQAAAEYAKSLLNPAGGSTYYNPGGNVGAGYSPLPLFGGSVGTPGLGSYGFGNSGGGYADFGNPNGANPYQVYSTGGSGQSNYDPYASFADFGFSDGFGG